MLAKTQRYESIPDGSGLLEGFAHVDFLESVGISDGGRCSAREVADEFFKLPGWVRSLFAVRDAIVKPFGLKTSADNQGLKTFFPILAESADELIMGEADKHLDFRVSVMTSKQAGMSSVTTVVHYHNFWGKMYFFFVKMVHGLMMKNMLKNYLRPAGR
jgi:hypothetical protein